MRLELPIVSKCEGCGRCCDGIGMPPFEARNPDLGPAPRGNWPRDVRPLDHILLDMELFDRMPAALRAEHAAAVRALKADPSKSPCIWFDAATKRCKNYDYRPAVCRAFLPSCEPCEALVKHPHATCSWQDDNSPESWQNPRRKRQPREWGPHRQDYGWLRWWLLVRPQASYIRDRRAGWSVFESAFRALWPIRWKRYAKKMRGRAAYHHSGRRHEITEADADLTDEGDAMK